MRKKIFLWSAVIFALAGSAGLLLYSSVNNRQIHADELISRASQSFKADLKKFIVNAGNAIEQLRKNTENLEILKISGDSLISFSAQLITNDSDLKGIVLFSDSLNYVFFREHTSWVTTFSRDNEDSLINWQRLNNNFEVLSEWTDTYSFFMDRKNADSLRLALKDKDKEGIVWSSGQSQIPDKRDLLYSVFRLQTTDRVPVGAAFLYKTTELQNRFSTILQFSNPLVTIVTLNGKKVTPMKTSDTAKISGYEILSGEVDKLFENWRALSFDQPRVYSFEKLGRVFWTRIDTIAPQTGVKGFAITVSQDDMAATVSRIDRTVLYFSLASFLVALLLFLFSRLKPKSRIVAPRLSPIREEQIKTLITNGESEHVEFKSSLRWDYREGKVNKVLEDVILKSIAAFANAKGGTLFIGVNDEPEVIGLEPDFNSLKKNDADYFELHLRKLINNQYSIRFSNTYLLMQFAVLNGKTVCVIHVAPSDYPLFLKTRNKQGQMVEKFYVRSGNASQEIVMLNEINEYIEQRFK